MATEEEKARAQAFLDKWVDSFNLEEILTDLFVSVGGCRHPKTGKYLDRHGDEYDTLADRDKYGAAWIFLDYSG